MEKVIGSGKTLEAAINDGLNQLGIERSQAEWEIVQTGGIFRSFKVSVGILSLTTEKELSVLTKEEEPQVTAKAKAVKPEKAKKEKPTKPEKAEKPKKAEKSTKSDKADKAEKTEKAEKEEKPTKSDKTDGKKAKKQAASSKGKEFLQTVLDKAGFDLVVTEQENDEEILLLIEGSDTSAVIGHRGDVLDSLQFLTNVVATGVNDKRHIALDCENYREKRILTLNKLAQNLEKKVVRTGRRTKLEPMNSYERRILHTALKDSQNVITHSEGSEPFRFVVIEPSDKIRELRRDEYQHQQQQPKSDAEEDEKSGTYGSKHKKLNFVYRTKSKKPFSK